MHVQNIVFALQGVCGSSAFCHINISHYVLTFEYHPVACRKKTQCGSE